LALNAIHPASRGESPLLSIMAMGVGLVFIAPRLFLSALAYFKILQGRSWARVLILVLTGLSVFSAIQSARLALIMGVPLPGWLLWFLLEGAASFLYVIAAAFLFSKAANVWFNMDAPSDRIPPK
jgi:hypothetical protein